MCKGVVVLKNTLKMLRNVEEIHKKIHEKQNNLYTWYGNCSYIHMHYIAHST